MKKLLHTRLFDWTVQEVAGTLATDEDAHISVKSDGGETGVIPILRKQLGLAGEKLGEKVTIHITIFTKEPTK